MPVPCWFAGLTTLDLVHRGPHTPGANEKVTATGRYLCAGGPAANAAVTAAALDVDPLLITAVGASPVADLARTDLERYGVRVLDTCADHDLAISSVFVNETTGERSVVSLDAGAAHTLAPDLTGEADPAAVLLDGHHPELQRAVLARARERGALVVLDAGRWRPVFAELIAQADVVACSADFRLPGGGCGPEALRRYGARAVVVTDGAAPVLWDDGATAGRIDVPAVAARDTLAAGDVFHGALTAELARGAALAGAVEVAVATASLHVQHVGTRSFLRGLPAHLGR